MHLINCGRMKMKENGLLSILPLSLLEEYGFKKRFFEKESDITGS